MVFKDELGTDQALAELPEHDKTFLQAKDDKNIQNTNKEPKKLYLMPSATAGFEPIHHIEPQVMEEMTKLFQKGLYGPCHCGDDCNCQTCKCHAGAYPQAFDDALTKYVEQQYKKYVVLKKAKKLKEAEEKAKGNGGEDPNYTDSDSTSDEECNCLEDCICDELDHSTTEEDDEEDTPEFNINLNN